LSKVQDLVLEVERFRVYIYEPNHAPAHVHVWSKGNEVTILLVPDVLHD